jgi:hypothetical protein
MAADHAGMEFVYRLCAFLPTIGLPAALLPEIEKRNWTPLPLEGGEVGSGGVTRYGLRASA